MLDKGELKVNLLLGAGMERIGRCDVCINKEKTVSIHSDADGQNLPLGFRRNRGEIAEIVIFISVWDGFEIFRISTVGDTDTCDLA